MPRRKLRRPDFVVGAAGIRVLPGVADIERAADHAGADFLAEQAFQHIFVERQRVLREDRIAELLELVENLVIQARIVMIRPAEHDDADAVLALELVEHLARAAADAGFVVLQRRESGLDGTVVFFLRKPENRLPRLQHLVGRTACGRRS